MTSDSNNLNKQPAAGDSPWPRRLAVLLVGATFPLIFVGGLVTTYDAGMAVPDWPNTYGYNLFLYPLTSWFAAPFNLFVEHGHRLLGATVGLLMILLAVAVWRRDNRRWMRALAVAAFGLVCLQGALGGMRVLFDERARARTHACVGPLFFAMAVCLAVFTSRRWQSLPPAAEHPGAARLQMAAALTALLAYLQIVAGAFLRHFPVGGDYRDFRAAMFFHLILAGALLIHAVWLFVLALRQHRHSAVFPPVARLAAFMIVQLALGAATYVLKYNWPEWFAGYDFAADTVVERRAFWPAIITTAHVAVGSLVFVTAVSAALWPLRVFRPAMLPSPGAIPARAWEVAA